MKFSLPFAPLHPRELPPLAIVATIEVAPLALRCIASANSGTPWSQTFSYDAFGNLSKSGTISFQPTYSYLTNRMTQIGSSTPTYDANGNVTNDTLHTYTWDAAGRPVTIDTVGLTYDALGRMVEQNRSSVYTEIVYGPGGGKLALMSGQTLQKAFVPLTGGAVAVYNSSGLAFYRHSDWLGSSRFASTPTRTMYSDGAYAPFGEPYAQSGTADLSFTGMNQDTVSGLYDFAAREYGTQGRWPSPDPLGIGAASKSDPQSWNLYAYVRNSPLHAVDPYGLKLILPGRLPGGEGFGSYQRAGSAGDLNGDLQTELGSISLGEFAPQWGTGASSNTSSQSASQDTQGASQTTKSGDGGSAYDAAQQAKEAILQLFQQNPDCADMFGGLDNATAALNNMNIVVVPMTPMDLTDSANAAAWNAIVQSNASQTFPNYNAPAAATAWTTDPGSSAWDQGSYNTFIGANFASLAPDQQESVLMHEMAHPITGYNSTYAGGIMEQPSSPYSVPNLLNNWVH